MVIARILQRLLPSRELQAFSDLNGWRIYYIELMLFLALIAMPLGLAFAFPTYIAENRWGLILFDAAVVAFIAGVLIFRKSVPFIKTFFLLLYGMILIFLIFLGPLYARPGWLVMGVVSAAFLFGVRAAIATTFVNAFLLLALFFYGGPFFPEWKTIQSEPLNKWIMFCANLSLVSLMAAIPVGFLLNRMNILLTREQRLGRKMAQESAKLQEINRRLEEEITQRNLAEAEKKRLELELIQAQKMEAMGTLAGGIAHDFNNILAAIIGYSELALSDPDTDAKTKAKIAEILKSGERAKALVQQILAFSRKAEIRIEPLDLSSTVSEALKMMRALVPTNIQLDSDIEPSCRILSSSTYIHQILLNLFNNAISALGADGGTLSITLTRRYLGESDGRALGLAAGPYLKLMVADTGHGMTPEIAARAFEPYFTTKEMGSGTGLGLSVVHGIVKTHGGAIQCASRPGTGTTFDLYLPEIVTAAPTGTVSEQKPSFAGTESILHVDDEESIADVTKQMLENLGYSVVSTTSSIEAFNLFTQNPDRFDIVLTDMTMPDLTGDRLAQKIMAIRPETPIILCTGHSDHINADEATRQGIRQFLMKPYDMAQLSCALRQAIDKTGKSNPSTDKTAPASETIEAPGLLDEK